MLQFIATGTILGASAGVAPGPLLTLVVAETLKHNIKEGIKVSLAPIITDMPIIILSLFLLEKIIYRIKRMIILYLPAGIE